VHPYLLDLYAKQRHADALRAAERWRMAREREQEVRSRRGEVRPTHRAKASRGPSPVQRLGWVLVAIGLRLAVRGSPAKRPSRKGNRPDVATALP
jgi:hypothetical protein